ncbi:MAG: LEA type 2 family protein [Elusimicrobiaceae bacterium]|nr:LEA type 2 family protein [Elusimicrobiaceae bacterium]
MKKIFILLLSSVVLGACVTLKEINQTIDCKYDLMGVEVTEYSLDNLSADVALAITNKSKDTNARMTRFTGKVYLNDTPIADVNLGEFLIEPQSTKVEKVSINVPFSQVGKNILGLVLANSKTINYKVVGTAYFASPLGDIPFPIVFTRSEK